jgi:iron-sulfur cluster assembly protein
MKKTAITLTDRAADHVRQFLAKQSGGVGLRIAIKPTGCSGYQYVVNLAESTSESDTVFESHGINIIVDGKSFPVLDGTKMDYIKEGLTEGFRFHNPNVDQTCGCGESFSIKEGNTIQTG